ncbi:MAG: hypothetical protein LRY55_03220, partial [Leadbetterella sp.]|nr:hypothetical protein [Leadbetterella sp.]
AGKLATGRATDQAAIARKLNFSNRPQGDGWIAPATVGKDSVVWVARGVEGDLRNLIGLTLRDALPVLENKNYIVQHTGFGRIADISLEGRRVHLVLR